MYLSMRSKRKLLPVRKAPMTPTTATFSTPERLSAASSSLISSSPTTTLLVCKSILTICNGLPGGVGSSCAVEVLLTSAGAASATSAVAVAAMAARPEVLRLLLNTDGSGTGAFRAIAAAAWPALPLPRKPWPLPQLRRDVRRRPAKATPTPNAAAAAPTTCADATGACPNEDACAGTAAAAQAVAAELPVAVDGDETTAAGGGSAGAETATMATSPPVKVAKLAKWSWDGVLVWP
mmetsp:Transcript_73286/g.184641  ORF Transcript_73286/g.184641 Transcript_73286/m.184641 type:complete len:236 (+) Transcript_73286:1786-2493(+)